MAAPLPGTLDESYQPDLDGGVVSIAPLPDGKAYIAGYFRHVNGAARPGLARLNADGTLDASFDPGTGANAPGYYTALLVQPDSNLLVTGSFTNFNGAPQYGVARLKPDGTVDADFHSDARIGTDAVACVAVQTDGGLIIGGEFGNIVGQTNFPDPLVRLNANGAVDDSFAPLFLPQLFPIGMGSQASVPFNMGDLNVRPNGEILLRATYSWLETSNCPPGTQIQGYNGANAIAVQDDGKVLAEGHYFYTIIVNGYPTLPEYFCRYNLDGTQDDSFKPQIETEYTKPMQILAQPDGKILVIGSVYSPLANKKTYIARLHPNGMEDPHFKASTEQAANVIVRQADGSYLLGGSFLSVNGKSHPFLARLLGDDPTPRPPTVISDLTPQEIYEGATNNLTAIIDGPALAYQWQFNGLDIAGETNEYLIINKASAANDGFYTLVASNAWGAVTSATARIAVTHRLVDALNAPDLPWKTAFVTNGQPMSDSGWVVSTNSIIPSGLSACTPAPKTPGDLAFPGQWFLLQTTVKGPGLLTFWAYGGFHFGFAPTNATHEFYPPEAWSYRSDFETPNLPYGPFEWRQYCYNIPEGQQALAWADNYKYGPPATIDEVTFIPAPDQPVLLWQRTTNGPISLSLLGKSEAVYDLERTMDFKQWTKVATLTNKAGMVEYFKLPSTPEAYSFYRVAQLTNTASPSAN